MATAKHRAIDQFRRRKRLERKHEELGYALTLTQEQTNDFAAALNDKGRAGFVMANSASDAGGSEREMRRKLIETGAVDVIVSTSPNMFFTVTLPVTLWFLDKGKKSTPRADEVLFIDARHIFRQVSRAQRDFTPDQIEFIGNIVRLWRGQEEELEAGSGPAMTALISGEVSGSMTTLVTSIPHAKAGRLRTVGVTTAKRARALPDVPAIGETVPGYEVVHWYGMWGPKGLPNNVVMLWNREDAKVLHTSATEKWLEAQGLERAGGPPDEFRNRLKVDVAKWKRVVKEARITTK